MWHDGVFSHLVSSKKNTRPHLIMIAPRCPKIKNVTQQKQASIISKRHDYDEMMMWKSNLIRIQNVRCFESCRRGVRDVIWLS